LFRSIEARTSRQSVIRIQEQRGDLNLRRNSALDFSESKDDDSVLLFAAATGVQADGVPNSLVLQAGNYFQQTTPHA
jgi:hypothetical protein